MVHVPKVMQQERVSHQQVEQTVEVPVPMTQDRELANCASYDASGLYNGLLSLVLLQEEVVHVPKVMQHERQHHFHVEVWLLCMILIQLSQCIRLCTVTYRRYFFETDVWKSAAGDCGCSCGAAR